MNRDQLLAARTRRVEAVEVEGIGKVYIRAISARDALALESDIGKIDKNGEAGGLPPLVALQLASFISDVAGNAILNRDDAAALLDIWSANQVREVIRAGVKLNALGDESVEAAGGN
jgi:hypothetical protein